jgi:hypothetical protein
MRSLFGRAIGVAVRLAIGFALTSVFAACNGSASTADLGPSDFAGGAGADFAGADFRTLPPALIDCRSPDPAADLAICDGCPTTTPGLGPHQGSCPSTGLFCSYSNGDRCTCQSDGTFTCGAA